MKESEGERLFREGWAATGQPEPVQEHQFHPVRRWRLDFAWPDQRLAVEIEGGTWSGGRHTRGAGFEKDCEKYNAAAVDGWTVLRFTTRQVKRDWATVQSTVLAAMGAE